jgi:uncharacterized RDD family membrane protein YckC
VNPQLQPQVQPQAQAHLPGTRPGTVLVPQGALVRGPAFLIDTFLCSLAAGLMVGGSATLVKILVATLAVDFVYFAACEGLFGTTAGKRLFGLRVVRASDGRPCGPLAAVVRTVLRLVDNIFFSLPGITAIVRSPRRQRLGDRAAKTLVVSEVPEQLLKVFNNLSAGVFPGAPQAVASPSGEVGPSIQAAEEALRVDVLENVVPCPFCDEPMSEDEIVCRHCDHYVNQASAHGETESMAPIPQLYSEDRNLRFDALWRLVFAGDEESLEAVENAVKTWPRTDKLLAVHAFTEVDDPRPIAFLTFMADDEDQALRALAREVRSKLSPQA